jgi:transcriptional regulator NrdR family protein
MLKNTIGVGKWCLQGANDVQSNEVIEEVVERLRRNGNLAASICKLRLAAVWRKFFLLDTIAVGRNR